MLLKMASELGKTILNMVWQVLIPNSLLLNGIISSHKGILTIIFLLDSGANTKLSANSYLHGNFDFNGTPLTPPGQGVLIHSKSTTHKTWEVHREDGWYIGTSLEHYRCVKCYVPSNNAIRDVDTVKLFPTQITFLSITTEDYFNQSAKDMLSILQITPSVVPSLKYGDRTKNALIKTAELLGQATKKPTIALPVATPTPTLLHISLSVKYHRVAVTPVLPTVPYHRVPISQPTPHKRGQK